MSKATDTTTTNVPLFARLLQSSEAPSVVGGGGAPTYHCLDQPCTKKYPSDDDEPTFSSWDR
jgi:hypothetical protein